MKIPRPIFIFLITLSAASAAFPETESQDDIQARYRSGIANHRLGRLDAAMRDYEFLEKQGAADYRVFNNMGVILASRKKYREAEAYFKKALERKPGQPDARNNLLKLYADTKNYRAAIEEYKQIRKSGTKK